MLTANDRSVLAELAPVLRRGVSLDPAVLARLRLRGSTAGVLVRLPFAVLVARTVECPARADPVDVAVRAAEALAWLDGETDAPPEPRDADWRTGLPPDSGWTRIETVPDEVLRPLVRQGALALKDAAAREGVPGAQPRAEIADALLDSVVLTVTADRGSCADAPGSVGASAHDLGRSAEVTLRTLSALTRMGFLARGGQAHVDVRGRWTRVVGAYGTVFAERPGAGLGLTPR